MSPASDPAVVALRRGFVDLIGKFYGTRAVIRSVANRIVASANPDASKRGPGDGTDWKIFLSIAGDRLRLRLLPAGEVYVLPLYDPDMWQELDDILERPVPPACWTVPLIEELIRARFDGCARISRWQDEFDIRPHGPYHRVLVIVLRDLTGFPAICEVRHGPQHCKWNLRIRVRVDLGGDPEAAREQLLDALTPRRLLHPPSDAPHGLSWGPEII